jgi:hypothetical protein
MQAQVIRKLLIVAACALVAFLTVNRAQAQPPDLLGLWNFDSSNLVATVGTDLDYVGDTASRTAFGTTASLGLPAIDGTNAVVMQFPTNAIGQGYRIDLFGAQANGGGNSVNQWTIMFDLLFPTASANKFRALMDTDNRGISQDADLMIASNGGIGGHGSFDGQIQANTWYRIGFVIDTPANVIRKYINGTFVGTQSATCCGTAPVDGNWALVPGSTAELFNDDDGQTATGYVNSIQLRTAALSTPQMAAFAGPSASGIPQNIPPVPSFVDSWIPAKTLAVSSTDVGAVIFKGDSTVTAIELRLDNVLQSSPTITTDGDLITVRKTPAAPFLVASKHTIQVSYTDSQTGGTKTFSRQFDVAVFLEDFEELTLGLNVEEGGAGTTNAWTKTPPAGWMIDDSGVPGAGDPSMDGVTEWAGWSFASKDWWANVAGDQERTAFAKGSGTVAIADPDEWDDAGHAAGTYNTFMKTPVISLAGAAPNTVVFQFDSSWRDECCDDSALTNDQTAVIWLSYNGGPSNVVFHWSSNPADAAFHDDNPNETVILQLSNPPSATTMQLTFGLLYSENDWWWAIDNLQIVAGTLPPAITTHPQSDLVYTGANVTLSVRASSTEPPMYQWLLNDALIVGATSSNLTFMNVQETNAGNYRAIVSNSAGSVTSQVARLEVFGGSITQDLVVHLKLDGNFSDSSGHGNNAAGGASGTPTFVTGKVGAQAMHIGADPNVFDYATLGAPPDLNFGTTTDFSIAFWARLVAWSGDPSFVGNKDWNAGGNPAYVIFTEGDGRVGVNLAGPPGGRKDLSVAGGTFGSGSVGNNVWHHVTVTMDRDGSGFVYVDGARQQGVLNLAASQNNLDTPPGFATNIGQDGTGSYGPKFSNADFDDVGIWRRVLTPQEVASIYSQGLLGMDLSTATGVPTAVPPMITAQPQNRTVIAGFPVSFSVTASGTPPIAYQWRKGGSNLSGQTNASLTINNVQESDEGSYDVVVTNSAGNATSNPATLTVNPAPPALVTGQWDFNDSNLVATVGQNLEYFNATIQADTSFGTTTSLGIPDIGGVPATVMCYNPSVASWGGYIMRHGAQPNGGGAFVNLYTIIYDIFYPPTSDHKWRSLLQTSTNNANDGDFFINDSSNGIGISGNYQGSVSANQWHRIALVVNLSIPQVSKYIDGTNVGNQTLSAGIDGRWSLDTFALLFADEDGETTNGYVNSIQFRNWVMTDAEIADLGTPTAGGIPAPLTFTGAQASGGNITMNWAGGTAPYTVQMKTNLTDAEWVDVLTTNATTVVLPTSGASGFFRVVNRVTFNITLNGANERPTPVDPAGTGTATVTLDGNLVTVNGTYSGMTSAVNNAHIHGPATTEQFAGVILGLTHTAGTSGTISGSGTLSAQNVQRVLDGLTYINIHTVNNSSGEIRGQIVSAP